MSTIEQPIRTGQAMCPYCGVGCLIDIKTQNNQVIELRGTVDSPVNRGLLCPKGALLSPVLELEGRLLQPAYRPHRGADLVEISWEEAITRISERLLETHAKHGGESLAIYGSGQLDTESWYLANKLFKGYLGSNHTVSNSRLCMASAVVAYNTMLGSDGPPTCYEDIDYSDCYLVAGSNMADTHPVLFQHVKAHRRKNSDNVLIVIDPRLSNTAKAADIHVPLKPGSDIAFFNALGRIILDQGAIDTTFIENHTLHFEDYANYLRSLDLPSLADECGISLDLIYQAANALMKSKALLSFYCMGLGQSRVGTAKHQALIDLHLMLGQIGKVGAGPFSLTGQPNAMGGRELGGLAHLLPGYRLIENEIMRHEVEDYWHVPHGSINPKKGLTTVEMIQAMEQGQIKALWVAGTNPLVSLPNLALAKRAFEKAELIITQDCFETETTQISDFVLPVAQWIERECTMTNSERRVTRNHQLADAPAEAKPDWWVFSQIGQAMGFEGFEFEGIQPIWDEFRGLTVGRPCDMGGMTNERLEQSPLQWPCPTEDHEGTARRYTDFQFATPDKRARFVVAQHQNPQENPSADYPFILTTGRLASQWHTMTRTGKIAKLANQAQTPYAEISVGDASKLGVEDGEMVEISSVRGAVVVEARLSDRISGGVVFMPFHWGDLFAPNQAANTLTIDVLDPLSKQPEFKACAVQLQKITRLYESELSEAGELKT